MKYYSTNRQSPVVDFKTATIQGQAPDKGLYFPQQIPQLDADWLKRLHNLSDEEIAFRVIKPYVGDVIPDDELFRICSETVNFPVPLVKLQNGVYALELYHGRTLAFKDIGARFMSRSLGYFMRNSQQSVTVLVATSGDTGGAVADGFYGVEGVEVVILYPKGKVSSVQERQLTTYGGNIRAVRVNGRFDDCQAMVKQAFLDKEITDQVFLTSANSINVARWLPQQFFYFSALKQWPIGDVAPVMAVPSGNFGNICAGLLAMVSGLPVRHFVAACNANDVVPRFLHGQPYEPMPAIATLSNAMDVGNPSNFVRIMELFRHERERLKEVLTAFSFSDAQTIDAIRQEYNGNEYLLDPHGAVGLLALKKYAQLHHDAPGIFLETAHPVKFYDVVEPIIGEKIPLPTTIEKAMIRPMQVTDLEATDRALKEYLLSGGD
jgi:threonine synthase